MAGEIESGPNRNPLTLLFSILLIVWAIPVLVIYWIISSNPLQKAVKIAVLLMSTGTGTMYFLYNRDQFPSIADTCTWVSQKHHCATYKPVFPRFLKVGNCVSIFCKRSNLPSLPRGRAEFNPLPILRRLVCFCRYLCRYGSKSGARPINPCKSLFFRAFKASPPLPLQSL